MKLLKQSLVVILAIVTVFVIANTEAAGYIPQILGVLVIFSLIYIIIQKRRHKDKELFVGSNLEFFAITVGLLLTIFLTDGLYSNLFFLVYFLLFGLSFMFEPFTVFVFLIGLLVLFISQALQNDVFSNMLRLGSLVLLSPIAFFFGREFRRRERLEDQVEMKTEKIISNVQKVIEKESDKMSASEIEAISTISNDAQDLREEAEKE